MTARGESVAIVTGAARGLGRAHALALAQEGHRVVVADIRDGDGVASEISNTGGNAFAVHVDVSDKASTERMAHETIDRFGRIDVLVNNAGYFSEIRKRSFEEIEVDEWDHAFAVNVRGTWLATRAVVPFMRAARYGKVINTSSMTVPSGIPYFLHYVASKSAIVGLTRALARELGDDNIAVNTISPDYIPHDAEVAGRQPEMAALIAQQRCFKRDQVPEDMVGIVLFLAGRGSDFITGQNFLVNGGRLFS